MDDLTCPGVPPEPGAGAGAGLPEIGILVRERERAFLGTGPDKRVPAMLARLRTCVVVYLVVLCFGRLLLLTAAAMRCGGWEVLRIGGQDFGLLPSDPLFIYRVLQCAEPSPVWVNVYLGIWWVLATISDRP
ncbi:hypothetical protein BJY01DRAFT_149587 [Aspergillus pseudoustus]|uniref:GPI mannosyltransferase I n=1 Tax=Aspergillus pseudoustus TaxID=1810923 RepID=A0ABR4KA80_9EURO